MPVGSAVCEMAMQMKKKKLVRRWIAAGELAEKPAVGQVVVQDDGVARVLRGACARVGRVDARPQRVDGGGRAPRIALLVEDLERWR